MKNLQVIKLILFVLIIPLLWGCSSDKLSRGKAEKLIRAINKFPTDEIKEFQTAFPDHWGAGSLEELQNQGLLTYTKYFAGLGGYWFDAELTEKGKKYAVSDKHGLKNEFGLEDNYNKAITVKIAKLDFGEITGIHENKESNTATVNYTVVRKEITPFGKIEYKLQEGSFNKTITFTKYDDGWRPNKINDNE